MPWLAVAWITVTHCFTTQKGILYWQTTKSSKCLMLHGVQTKYCDVTPFLHKLHWLPIHYCILFKYNLLNYKAIHFSQPPYLSSLIRRSDLTQGNRLSISSSKPNKCSGLHSFIVAAPIEWNKLPQAIITIESISSLRKQLKTYFFRLAYRPP